MNKKKEELHYWRNEAHKYFDIIWKEGHEKREEVYKYLANYLNIPVDKCHIGMLLFQNIEINRCLYAKIEGNLFTENGKTTGNYRELYTEPIFWYPLPEIPHIISY